MVEKKGEVEKKSAKKKAMTKTEIEQALIENFVSMQKVLANLATKFEGLSEQISKLLQLFEISAKSFVQGQEKTEVQINKELADKIDLILEQNKIIAKGITLIEETTRESPNPFSAIQLSTQSPRPLPRY